MKLYLMAKTMSKVSAVPDKKKRTQNLANQFQQENKYSTGVLSI